MAVAFDQAAGTVPAQQETTMDQIRFDGSRESQVFQIGTDRIYFVRNDDETSLTVAMAVTGEPWSRTTQYMTFASKALAEWFLQAAQAEDALPHGWQ
jgi:hypothetical protein